MQCGRRVTRDLSLAARVRSGRSASASTRPCAGPNATSRDGDGRRGPLTLALAGDEVEHEIGQGAPLVLCRIELGLHRSFCVALSHALKSPCGKGSGMWMTQPFVEGNQLLPPRMSLLTLSPSAPLATSSFTSRTRHSLSASVNSTSIVCSLFCPMVCLLLVARRNCQNEKNGQFLRFTATSFSRNVGNGESGPQSSFTTTPGFERRVGF